jgi:hypothetical protein
MVFIFIVTTYESFVAFAYNVCLTSSVLRMSMVTIDRQARNRAHLRIPVLTTARTTAFIPALSPPDVRTANFILVSGSIAIVVPCCDRRLRVLYVGIAEGVLSWMKSKGCGLSDSIVYYSDMIVMRINIG